MGWEGRGRWGRCRAGRETREEGGERPAELSAPGQGGVGVPQQRRPCPLVSDFLGPPPVELRKPPGLGCWHLHASPSCSCRSSVTSCGVSPCPPPRVSVSELPGDDGTRLASRRLSCSSLLGPTSSLVQLP